MDRVEAENPPNIVQEQQRNKAHAPSMDQVSVRFLKTGRYGDPDPSLQIPLIVAREGDIKNIRRAHYEKFVSRAEKGGYDCWVELEHPEAAPEVETVDDGSVSDLGNDAGAEGAHRDETPDPLEKARASRKRRERGRGASDPAPE